MLKTSKTQLTVTDISLEEYFQEPKTIVQTCVSYGKFLRSMGHVLYMVIIGTQMRLPSNKTITVSSYLGSGVPCTALRHIKTIVKFNCNHKD